MKKVGLVIGFGLLVSMCAAPSVLGRPDYRKQFEAFYKDAKVIEAAKEAKCNICHYGKSKKNRNDYGTALSKLLTEEQYKALRTNKPELNKKIVEALKTVAKQKSVSGKTFAERIEAGELPGTPPEDAE